MMKTTPFYIRLSEEQLLLIDAVFEGRTISEKVRDFVSSAYINKHISENKIKELESKISLLKESLKTNPFSEDYEISKEEEEFLEKAKSVLDKDGGDKYLIGQCNHYNNKFGHKLTHKEFKLIVR